MLVYTSQKLLPPSKAEQVQSPPTRDPGLKAIRSEPQLSREIRKLQKELETYVQRIEQLVNKGNACHVSSYFCCVVSVWIDTEGMSVLFAAGRIAESVEPEEKHRIEIRQQEQAARSARIIYVLQQQVSTSVRQQISYVLNSCSTCPCGYLYAFKKISRLMCG